jgi:hypothetical protein
MFRTACASRVESSWVGSDRYSDHSAQFDSTRQSSWVWWNRIRPIAIKTFCFVPHQQKPLRWKSKLSTSFFIGTWTFVTFFQSLLKLYPLNHFSNHLLKRLITPHFWGAMAFRASISWNGTFVCLYFYYVHFSTNFLIVFFRGASQLLYYSALVFPCTSFAFCFYHRRILHFNCFMCTIGNT